MLLRKVVSIVLILVLMMAGLPFPAFASGRITWELETLDHGTITESTYEDDVQLLVFYNATEGTCFNSMQLIRQLGTAAWTGQEGLRVIAIDGQDSGRDAVAAFREAYAPDSELIFAVNGNHTMAEYLYSVTQDDLNQYCICVILKEGVIQEIWGGCSSADICREQLSGYIKIVSSEPSGDPGSPSADSGSDLLQVEVSGQFRQSEARTQLEMINAFRADPDAWYWNEDNETKTYPNGDGQEKLKPLAYDYELEKIAMQRAVELTVNFDHIRPDGARSDDWCFSPDSPQYLSYLSFGENIAAGSGYPTAESVFYGWCEEDEPYEWQGHRRNMLNDKFNVVGLGAFEHDGVIYWVQEFGYADFGTAETPANDEPVTWTVESLPGYADPQMFTFDNSIKIFKQRILSLTNGAGSLKYKHELITDQFIAADEVPEGMTVWVSSYDADGRFLGLSEMTAEEYAAAQKGASDVRIFCVDGSYIPAAEAMEIPLE